VGAGSENQRSLYCTANGRAKRVRIGERRLATLSGDRQPMRRRASLEGSLDGTDNIING